MKNRSKGKCAALVMTGVLIGASLPSAVMAAEDYLKAVPSPQEFFVDGHRVELEAYSIGGHNYVKLRDIGKAVDFSISYDPFTNAVIVISGMPYQEEQPATAPSTPAPTSTDYVAQANPVVFTGYLTEEVYDMIRETMLTGQTTSFGSAVSGFKGLKYGDDKALFQKAEQELQQIKSVLATLGPYPSYQLIADTDGYLCQVDYAELYAPAVAHTKDFIVSLNGLSEREKIKRIAWYVCDRLAYDKTCYAWPHEVLVQDGVVRGACMSYAYSFQFLCRQAGIPCLLVTSDTHQWNTVYTEGKWWEVDVTADDCDAVHLSVSGAHGETLEETYISFDSTDEFRERYYIGSDRVLWDRTDRQYLSDDHTDIQPEITAFAKELLAPGSTK